VGKKKLDQAIDTFQSTPNKPPIHVEWKPYIIDPNTKIDGEEFEAYNIRRWGSSGWTRSLKTSGRKVGATFENWKTWPNTLRAHQLIAFVTSNDRLASVENVPTTAECNAALFEATYELGENISLVDTLVKIGTEKLRVGSEEIPRLRSYLENNEGAREVMKEIQSGRKQYNIRGVPFFIIGTSEAGQTPYGFSGAQDSSTYLEIFQELSESLEK